MCVLRLCETSSACLQGSTGVDGPDRDGDTGSSASLTAPTPVALVCVDPTWEHAYGWLLHGSGVHVAAKVRNLDRALDLVTRLAPVVLLVHVDEELEPCRLMRRIRELRHAQPSLGILVTCSRGDDAAHDAALAGGADAVVRRENALDVLRAVDVVAHGGPTCTERPQLTLRELEVLRLVSEGHTSREVARAMWVTEQTVKYHLANIYRRVGVGNRTEAVEWAVANGVVDRVGAAG